jgi:16S rRNA (cytidine1402-2'-O)-methyltransferase
MLVVASTHIGNIEDTPARSLQYVVSADILLFEEDRPARQILKRAGVHREYYKYNEHRQVDQDVKDALMTGKTVAFMSDQGTANLADPGRELLEFAHKNSIPIKVIPGPSSITAALSACPFSTQPFTFYGFLAKRSEDRTKQLTNIANQTQAIVLMDTPYRLAAFCEDLKRVFGKKRKGLLALDISGPSEDFIFGNCDEIYAFSKNITEKTNFVFVLAPTLSESSRPVRGRPNQKK